MVALALCPCAFRLPSHSQVRDHRRGVVVKLNYRKQPEKTYMSTKNNGKPVPKDCKQSPVYEALLVLQYQKHNFMSPAVSIQNISCWGVDPCSYVAPYPVDGSSRSLTSIGLLSAVKPKLRSELWPLVASSASARNLLFHL